MTTHVLIACSKSKFSEPEEVMIWSPKMDLISWNEEWNNQSTLFAPEILYTGRSFRQQYQIVMEANNVQLHIISAGAGLVSLPVEIPSYEATFRKEMGPKATEWHQLPHGGIERFELNVGDTIVSFAPPQYHRVLLHDPNIKKVLSQLIVPSTSPLSSIAGTVIPIHPRSKEVMKSASSDLNTEFLRIYFSEGIDGFKRIAVEAEKLPSRIERSSISDEDLRQLISKLEGIQSFNGLVRHLRDELLIKASVERISAARKFIQKKD